MYKKAIEGLIESAFLMIVYPICLIGFTLGFIVMLPFIIIWAGVVDEGRKESIDRLDVL